VPHASGLWARTVPHAARRASHSRRTYRTFLPLRDCADDVVAVVVQSTFGSPSLSWEAEGAGFGMLKERAILPVASGRCSLRGRTVISQWLHMAARPSCSGRGRMARIGRIGRTCSAVPLGEQVVRHDTTGINKKCPKGSSRIGFA
jgi:hypothetical protein